MERKTGNPYGHLRPNLSDKIQQMVKIFLQKVRTLACQDYYLLISLELCKRKIESMKSECFDMTFITLNNMNSIYFPDYL